MQNPEIHVTHLQGDGTTAVVALRDSGASTLDGFRITGGTGVTDPWSARGGGVFVSGGSPTLSRNTIENNDSRHPGLDDLGGGIFIEDSTVRIVDNMVRNNVASRGGGIAVDGGQALIHRNTVQGNTAAGDHGGGLYVSGNPLEISHNRILQNESGRSLGYGWGGGIVVFGETAAATLSFNHFSGNYSPSAGGGVFVDDGADVTLDHELIENNTSEEKGGAGIYVDGAWDNIGSTVTIGHCTIVDNRCSGCTFGGSGLLVEYYSAATVQDSIFWGNGGDDFYTDGTSQKTVTYTDSEETVAGTGNLSSDPLFADSGNNDYHLKSIKGRWDPTAGGGMGGWVADNEHSPCIDSGSPLSAFKNEPVPNGARSNMGVYGNTSEAAKSLKGGLPVSTVILLLLCE